ncbi:MAG: ankyrin repeat domain-containing protein [Rhodocyclaceae bacterium]|nr:ankyrin repeat domain-containing protein [Rhodocyclaceae bacterium]
MRWLFFLTWLLIQPGFTAELPDPVRFSTRLELGDIEAARRWLDSGLSPDFEGARIGTGLMIGAWEGNIPLMELFVSRGARIDAVNRFGETALMLAAWKNRKEAVRWLIDRGARIDQPDRQWSALHYAAFAGHGEIVDLLLAAGARVNARSTNGSTVLMMAVREGHEGLIERLLAAGADAALVNDHGDDAASWAMRQGRFALARRLADARRFAQLVEREVTRPAAPPQRSLPAPDIVEEQLRRARLFEAEGRRSEALAAYREALALIKAEQARSQPASAPPKALVIRASRTAPAKQSLFFVASDTAETEAERLLEHARNLEAQGRRQEALRFYREAAASIRASAAHSP